MRRVGERCAMSVAINRTDHDSVNILVGHAMARCVCNNDYKLFLYTD